ncbi:SiaB family protein kinase [Petroclostridium sp. X23]|jgi:hypothetical protein|uniref:SiaB family protein kinase n=1 Tax=Petroclostridium sp. X23 TaxID=3045146 RepID=UPI0024AE8651|nr:SiaB family protein kinase [Petroclostridium sp. X23]WHH58517.1 SiaB family protein kinase [Petroclostridium sp. X23]
MEKKLLGLQNILRKSGILISFSGRFSQGIIEELGEAIQKHMEAQDTPKSDVFNVFAVFIEQTQNIKNYTSLKQGSEGYDRISNSGIVSIGKSDSGYFIWSGNMVENADSTALIDKLEYVKKLDKNELKKLYKEQMKKDVLPDSMGAGVGLIEMARKASRPLEYSVEKIDDKFSFFELRVIV